MNGTYPRMPDFSVAARVLGAFRDALIAEGFTREEALELTSLYMASALPTHDHEDEG